MKTQEEVDGPYIPTVDNQLKLNKRRTLKHSTLDPQKEMSEVPKRSCENVIYPISSRQPKHIPSTHHILKS